MVGCIEEENRTVASVLAKIIHRAKKVLPTSHRDSFFLYRRGLVVATMTSKSWKKRCRFCQRSECFTHINVKVNYEAVYGSLKMSVVGTDMQLANSEYNIQRVKSTRELHCSTPLF